MPHENVHTIRAGRRTVKLVHSDRGFVGRQVPDPFVGMNSHEILNTWSVYAVRRIGSLSDEGLMTSWRYRVRTMLTFSFFRGRLL